MTKENNIHIGTRTKKTPENKLGWKDNVSISKDEPCILILGGSATVGTRSANGYAKQTEKLLKYNELEDYIKIYSAYYEFSDFKDVEISRDILMNKYGRKTNTNETDLKTPEYINKLFDQVILPRISDESFKNKLDVTQVLKNIRKLNIIAHCHGGYVAFKLEEMMQSKMQELGYSKEDMDKIQSQLLIIGLAPYAPLGISKSTFISFASINDDVVDHGNFFHEYIKQEKNNPNFKLSFFEKDKGNLFLVRQIAKGENDDAFDFNIANKVKGDAYNDFSQAALSLKNMMLTNKINSNLEHNFLEMQDDEYTDEGYYLNYIIENITINAIKNSLNQEDEFTPLPSVRDLTADTKLFDNALLKNNQSLCN